MVDPARTTNQKSARTGYAVWGWTANRLHVVEAHGGFHKPDEIIDEIFRLHALHDPIHVGVELVGLEEWMAQPLRHAMVQRGVALPLLPLRAPKDKNGFIGSLQPFYQAGEVTHAAALPDLVSELLAFPTGRKDVPNALAYALRMRAGRPVYEDFRPDHVRAIEPAARTPCWLLVNARPARTSGVLVQAIDGVLRVFADWVREGPPQETFSDLARDAALTAAAPLRIYAGSEHFDAHANVGLVQAARRGASLVQRGGPSEAASGSLAEYLRETRRGEPRMLVSPDARWTLKALSGGYARGLDKAGVVQDHPAENDYRMAMEPLEGFVRWFSALASTEESRQDVRYATTNDGRRYLSARR
jgi:hypothetical protein